MCNSGGNKALNTENYPKIGFHFLFSFNMRVYIMTQFALFWIIAGAFGKGIPTFAVSYCQ